MQIGILVLQSVKNTFSLCKEATRPTKVEQEPLRAMENGTSTQSTRIAKSYGLWTANHRLFYFIYVILQNSYTNK